MRERERERVRVRESKHSHTPTLDILIPIVSMFNCYMYTCVCRWQLLRLWFNCTEMTLQLLQWLTELHAGGFGERERCRWVWREGGREEEEVEGGTVKGGGGRERERKRKREGERERDRQTERERERERGGGKKKYLDIYPMFLVK